MELAIQLLTFKQHILAYKHIVTWTGGYLTFKKQLVFSSINLAVLPFFFFSHNMGRVGEVYNA